MITNPSFGVYAGDDYPESDWSAGPRPKSVFTGTSPVEEAVLAGLPSVAEPEPATNRGIYLFGPHISCPVRWLNGAAVLRCPLDGQRCQFFQAGRQVSPKHWAFLLDLAHRRKWVHPGPVCLRDKSFLCNGMVPSCQPYQAGKRDEGLQPVGCRAYGACWGSWRTVREFPACIQTLIEKDRGNDTWTAPRISPSVL